MGRVKESTIFSGVSPTPVISVNGADGISDIEGKAAMGSGERTGKWASFKSAVSPFQLFNASLAAGASQPP